MRSTLCCHRPLDHSRPAALARTCALATLLDTPHALRTTEDLPRPRTKPAIAPRLLPRLRNTLQHAYADCCPPVLPDCRIWSRYCRMDSRCLLVLFFHSRGPWRSRRT